MSSQCMTHIWPLDLYFMLQCFCHVSPTLSNRKASYFGYLFSLTLSVTSYYLEVTVTYISWSSDFALYFLLYLIDKHHTLGTCSVPYCEWLRIFVDHCDIFHGPVILPCISDPIKWEGIIFWILVPSDTFNDLIPFVGHCDLYFMVQWCCLISLALFQILLHIMLIICHNISLECPYSFIRYFG